MYIHHPLFPRRGCLLILFLLTLERIKILCYYSTDVLYICKIYKVVVRKMKKKENDIFDKIMSLPGLNIFEDVYKKYKEVLLYLFFGGMTTVISIGSYSYCDVGLHIDPLVANIISWILAVLFAYVTNKIWVFSAQTYGIGELFLEMIHFFGGRLFTLVLEEVILFIFINKLHFNSILVKIAAQFMVLVLNYMISKLLVFRKKQ